MSDNLSKTFDKELELVPAGTSMTDKTGSGAVFIGKGLVDADLVIDLTTVTGACAVALQFCDKANFSANVVSGSSISLTAGQTGRVILPFRNDPAGTPLAYVRLMPTVETALSLGAFMAKK